MIFIRKLVLLSLIVIVGTCENNVQAAGPPFHQKGIQRRNFTPKEDQAIITAVAKYGTESWSKVASEVPDRTARQCRDRYRHYLKPTNEMGANVPTRTPEECKSRFYELEHQGYPDQPWSSHEIRWLNIPSLSQTLFQPIPRPIRRPTREPGGKPGATQDNQMDILEQMIRTNQVRHQNDGNQHGSVDRMIMDGRIPLTYVVFPPVEEPPESESQQSFRGADQRRQNPQPE
jgi:hypothetical protein